MQISFYGLDDGYLKQSSQSNLSENSTASVASVHTEAVLGFVCQLVQTVLAKSKQPLIILDDDTHRLNLLDELLWQFEQTSFIPHTLIASEVVAHSDAHSLDAHGIDTHSLDTHGLDTYNNDHAPIIYMPMPAALSVPVILLPVCSQVLTLPQSFNGIILNLSIRPLPLVNFTHLPARVLEIILPDEINKEHSRNKYKYYRSCGYDLVYHPISSTQQPL